MTELWALIESFRERKLPATLSIRQLAMALDMSPTALSNWRDGIKEMPQRRNLLALADLTDVPYARVVDAALADAAYLPERAARAAEAARLADRAENERMLNEAAEASDLDVQRIKREAETLGITVSVYGDEYGFDYEAARAARGSQPAAARPGRPLDVVWESKLDEQLHDTQDEGQDMEPR